MSDRTRILVVDDDRRMVRTMHDILRLNGYDVVIAHSGDEAVEQAKLSPPDCVLMDLKMPGIDGVDALKAIRDVCPGMPVILMSAYASEEQVSEAKRHGAAAVLTKPIDIQQVLSFLSLLRRETSIMVVDDDLSFSRTIRDILQAKGYRVVTEEDPAKVLGHMEQQYQLVVIVNLKLGKHDGLEVLRSVRARYPGKPVVLVTGYRQEMAASIEKGLQVGAYTCLYKPFATEELLGIIAEISRKKRNSVLGEPF
jgi:DNA-binding NtrC family response regulator